MEVSRSAALTSPTRPRLCSHHQSASPRLNELLKVYCAFAALSCEQNWGLITYRFDALLLQPNEFTVAQLQRVAQVVAHELAHQWFGNLVTAAWWSDSQPCTHIRTLS